MESKVKQVPLFQVGGRGKRKLRDMVEIREVKTLELIEDAIIN